MLSSPLAGEHTAGNPVSCRPAMHPCCSNKENCAAKIITDGKICFWALGTQRLRNHSTETSPSSQGDHKSLQTHCKPQTAGCCLVLMCSIETRTNCSDSVNHRAFHSPNTHKDSLIGATSLQQKKVAVECPKVIQMSNGGNKG